MSMCVIDRHTKQTQDFHIYIFDNSSAVPFSCNFKITFFTMSFYPRDAMHKQCTLIAVRKCLVSVRLSASIGSKQ